MYSDTNTIPLKKRILLKISWEAFSWEKDFGVDIKSVEKIVEKILKIDRKNIELVIVIGWWNIYRWSNLIKSWINASDSHNLSMLSTVFNWVVLKNILEKYSIKSKVFDPNWIKFLTSYNKDDAKKELKKWKIVICVWWTWNPYFTTDTGWVIRSLELDCDMMIKVTKVDWVYNKDPVKYNDAKLYDEISYNEAILKNLKIMDQTALIIAKNEKLIIKVVNFNTELSIIKAISWEKIWTIIK
jgi:uridylate kinase